MGHEALDDGIGAAFNLVLGHLVLEGAAELIDGSGLGFTLWGLLDTAAVLVLGEQLLQLLNLILVLLEQGVLGVFVDRRLVLDVLGSRGIS